MLRPAASHAASTVRVGFRPVAPLVEESGGGVTGLEVDIITTALAHGGFQVQPYLGPHARLAAAVERGDIDGLAPLVGSIPGVLPTEPYLRYRNVALSLAARGLTIRTPADLRGLRVIVFQRAEQALGADIIATIRDTPGYREEAKQDQMLFALLSGRCDVVIGDRRILQHQIERARAQVHSREPVVEHDLFPVRDYPAGFRTPALVDAFNAGLAAMRADGRYDTLLAHHPVG
nr:ABC transporter substrate-binding protein [Oleisolibacter albus]